VPRIGAMGPSTVAGTSQMGQPINVSPVVRDRLKREVLNKIKVSTATV